MSCIEKPLSRHRCEDLEALFSECFKQSHNTVLIGGAEEPIYQIADNSNEHNRIYFTRDYYASGLHEIAHWLVAGDARRQQEDYGYWYAPDGRSPEQQAEFEKVEIKPQALECILSRAAGFPFRVSADNAEAGLMPGADFCTAIFDQVRSYCRGDLNARSQKLIAALSEFYGVKGADDESRYSRNEIR